MSRSSRRPHRAGAPIAAAMLLCACTGTPDDSSTGEEPTPREGTAQVSAPAVSTVLDGGGAIGLSVRASAAVWVASPVAITVTTDAQSIETAAQLATSRTLPALVVPRPDPGDPVGADQLPGDPGGPADPVGAELERLGVTHVLHVGPGAPALPGVEVVTSVEDLPEHDPPSPLAGVLAVSVVGKQTKGTTVALATLQQRGPTSWNSRGPIHGWSRPMWRRWLRRIRAWSSEWARGSARRACSAGVWPRPSPECSCPAVGRPSSMTSDTWPSTAIPCTGGLGVLGEQGPKGSVARARKRGSAVRGACPGRRSCPPSRSSPPLPSGGAGDDGNYSNEWDVDVLRPLVDAAARGRDLRRARPAVRPFGLPVPGHALRGAAASSPTSGSPWTRSGG